MNAFIFRLRATGAFFGAAFVLVGLASAFAPARPVVTVRVPPGSNAAEVQRAIDEALFVEVGVAAGWRTDRLIVERIVKSLSFIGVTDALDDVLAHAEALDLPRRDPLMRARLAERARAALVRVPDPSEADLVAALAVEPERYRRSTIIRFRHTLVGDPGPDLVLGPHPTRSVDELARTLGPDAAQTIAALAVGEPAIVQSPLGLHRVTVEARFPGAIPPLSSIRAEVAGRWREHELARREREVLAELRDAFRFAVEEAP